MKDGMPKPMRELKHFLINYGNDESFEIIPNQYGRCEKPSVTIIDAISRNNGSLEISCDLIPSLIEGIHAAQAEIERQIELDENEQS